MQKLPLRQRRHKSLLSQVARLTRKRQEAIATLVRAETMLPQLERKLRRMDGPPIKRKVETVTPAPELPTIEPKILADGIPDFLIRKQPEEKPVPVKAKKLRDAPAEAKAMLDAAIQGDDRTKQMEALGFRKAGRRKPVIAPQA